MRSSKIALISAFVAVAAFAAVDDPKKAEPQSADAPAHQPTAAEQKAYAAYEAYAAVGEEQAWLAQRTGKWTAVVSFSASADGAPHESTGTAEFSMDLDGHVLKQVYAGDMMGTPFTGVGYTGYDNAAKQSWYIWMDSGSSGCGTGRGTMDIAKGQIAWNCTETDPVTGRTVHKRGSEELTSDGRFVYKNYSTGIDGKEFVSLCIIYTRMGQAPGA